LYFTSKSAEVQLCAIKNSAPLNVPHSQGLDIYYSKKKENKSTQGILKRVEI